MAFSTRILGRVLGVGAVVLVAVVLGFIWYAHNQARSWLNGLPGKLGIQVTAETNGYTYSQTFEGKTVFTIRAAKSIQRTDGKITLKDVGIVIYGPKADREDRIRGAEFEYDPKAQVLKAIGEALIDLSGPPGKDAKAIGDPARMIHVKTMGLVIVQKTKTASTDGAVQFEAHGFTGNSVGASYDSGAGVLILNSEVKVSGLRGEPGAERPVQLTASHAVMERAGNVVRLTGPKYVSASDAGTQTVSADRAEVHLTEDGTPTSVQAEGRVMLSGGGRGTVRSDRMDVALNENGQPKVGHLFGGVRFVADTPARHEDGSGRDAVVNFDAAGRPVHAVVTGGVQMNETAGASERRLEAERVELAMNGGGKQKLVLRGAVASGEGGARVRIVDVASTLAISADTLTGRFGPQGLTGMDGVGKTFVERNEKGTTETSTGETLAIDLKPGAKGKMELARAMQHGNVEIVRSLAGKKAEVEHARGNQAVYEGATDRLVLTGSVEVSDPASDLFADRVQLDRASGDGIAEGAVRVNYVQESSKAEPVHVLAGRAVSHKSTGTTEFTAAAGGLVRMWQAGAQVEAPIVDFDRAKKALFAHGGGDAPTVRCVLPGAALDAGSKSTGVVRVLSREMRYTDASREVGFAGAVRVDQHGGTMRSPLATVFLAPREAGKTDSLMGGKVERVVGSGAVELTEPGRKAVGEKLVYTAADETFVLTGSKAAPPRLTDEARGTVTGASLRFRRGDDSVLILGSNGAADTGGRVRSEVPLEEKAAKRNGK